MSEKIRVACNLAHTHVTSEVCESILNRLSSFPQDSLGVIHPVSNGIFIVNTYISDFSNFTPKKSPRELQLLYTLAITEPRNTSNAISFETQWETSSSADVHHHPALHLDGPRGAI